MLPFKFLSSSNELELALHCNGLCIMTVEGCEAFITIYKNLLTSPLSVSRLSRKCDSLDVSHLHGSPWPVTGIVFLFFYINSYFDLKLHLPQNIIRTE
jgi:hypothetical protein